MENQKGFTLIELIVSIAIIAVLSGIILFSITQYISRAKDSNVSGSLAILVPAGEVYYNIENAAYQDGYTGFCNPDLNSVLKSAVAQMPQGITDCSSGLTPGVCCNVDNVYYDSWAACAEEFTTPAKAYCVDSRGVKKEICNSSCTASITSCPDDAFPNCT